MYLLTNQKDIGNSFRMALEDDRLLIKFRWTQCAPFLEHKAVMSRDITLRGSCVKGILPKMALSYKLEVGETWKGLETFRCNSHFGCLFFLLVKVKQKVVCSPSGATRLGSTFLAGQDGEDQQSNREITSNEASQNLSPHGGLSKMYETLVLKSGEDLSFQKC